MSKTPVRVAVTGAAGQIGYALAVPHRLRRNARQGPAGHPAAARGADGQAAEGAQGRDDGTGGCAFPLLAGMEAHGDPMTAFKDADYALLVGSRPRGPGMERAELLAVNARSSPRRARRSNAVAKRDVKVLVVGNPANTNAYIAMKSAPDLPRRRTSPRCCASTTTAPSARSPRRPASRSPTIEKLAVWGNHSPTMYADYRFATIDGASVKDMIGDQVWNADTFLPTVGKRGAAIIAARGVSSAASAANAAIDHMRDWALGTQGRVGHDGRAVRRRVRHSEGRDVRLPGDHRGRRVQDRRRPADRRLQPASASTRRWRSCGTSRTASSTCSEPTPGAVASPHGLRGLTASARYPPPRSAVRRRRAGAPALPGVRPLRRHRGAHAQEPRAAGRARPGVRRHARLRRRRAGRRRGRARADGRPSC